MSNIQKRDSFRIVLARCIRYGVASVKVPVRLALIGGVSFGIAAGIATFAAGSFFTNLIQQARDVYTVYRLTGERDELRASNLRLEQRLTAMQHEYERKAEFQREAKAKLENLDKAIASAGALSLFGKTEGKDAKKTKDSAKASGPSEPKTLAQVLRSPLLANRSKQTEAADDSGCKAGAECASKREIALQGDANAELLILPGSADEGNAAAMEEEQLLLEALESYTAAVERMPIGAPVFGRYSSGFGFRSSPFSDHRSFHEGIDISLPRGGRVVATGAGVVKKVGYHNHYGLTVDIEHSPEITTRYAHLSKALVKEGQVVDRGQRIGISGASGRATGPHVHYEVIQSGRPKNPKPLVALADSISDVL